MKNILLTKDRLIHDIKCALPSKRMVAVPSIASIDYNGQLIVIKTRFTEEETKFLLSNPQLITKVDSTNKDMLHDYNELHEKVVIFDSKLLNTRGIRALQKLVEKEYYND